MNGAGDASWLATAARRSSTSSASSNTAGCSRVADGRIHSESRPDSTRACVSLSPTRKDGSLGGKRPSRPHQPASLNRLRQHGCSPSLRFRGDENAVGCDKVMIALKADGA